MDSDDWSKVVLAAIPVVGAVAKFLRGAVKGRRGRLISDAALLGTVGLVQDATPRARDDRGRPIK